MEQPNHCDHCGTRFDKRKEIIFDDHLWFCELCITCKNRWYVGCECHYQNITLEEFHLNEGELRFKDWDDLEVNFFD